jgi:sterol 3beta-glucosyltransferase
MRIAIIATGSRGDVEPYIALGKGLKNTGHEVRLISHANFADLINPHDLEFWPVDVNVQDIAQSADMRQVLAGGNFLKVMSVMAKEAKSGAIHLARTGLDACQGMDIILTGLGGLYTGVALAEKLDIPLVQAHYIPFTPTRTYPSFLIPSGKSLGGSLNRFSYFVAQQVIWQGFRSADNIARKEELNLPRTSIWGPYNSKHTKPYPILYGYSPAVLPKPPDWGENIHITGYWFLDHDGDWAPPRTLIDFLDAGEPPVYVGFGSMSNREPEETTNLILKALAQANQRGIILSGWGGLQADNLPSTVLMVDSVPFSWLFPRMSAVVHHGGAGTTAAGLRAGVPSVVIPFFADQPFWGRRVAELGVGPVPIPMGKLTVDRLTQAIQIAVSDPIMRRSAAELGAKIQTEDGIARAADVLNKLSFS